MSAPILKQPSVEMLISAARSFTLLSSAADVKSMVTFARDRRFKVRSVLTNDQSFEVPKENNIRYNSKAEFRKEFTSFLSQSDKDYLIFYYSGHGTANWNRKTKQNEEYLCLNNNVSEFYKDSELTEDIDRYLKPLTTLYLVVDACRAGGVLNLWQLDVRFQNTVVLFSGSNSEISAYDDWDSPGGAFTNAFISSAHQGRRLYEIAQDVLEELFRPSDRLPVSPAVQYCRPDVCTTPFCGSLFK